MQLSELRSRLRVRVGNPAVSDIPNTTLDEHINTAYLDIANKYRFHNARKVCQFDTVDGTRRYGLPTDVAAVFRVRDNTNERKLEKLGDRRAAEQTSLTASIQEGKPLYYARYRDWIELFPIPDDVYEIEVFYKAVVAELSADDDVPAIPETWHQGILMLARFYYYDAQGDTPKATSAFNMFESWASRQPVEVDEEKVDLDSGVSIPTLNQHVERLDFDHSD